MFAKTKAVEPTLANFIPALFWLSVALAAVWFFPVFHHKKQYNRLFGALFLVKIMAGAGVWWIYTYYYTDRATSDIYRFFADARVAYDLLFTRPDLYLKVVTGVGGNSEELATVYDTMNNWYKSFDDGFINENRTLIRLNALLMPITLGSYFGNLVIVCFAGTAAQAYLFRAVADTLHVNALFAFALMNLWPSEIFWTSALMKEPILMAGLALAVGGLIRFKYKYKPLVLHAAMVTAGLIITFFSKFYVGVALFFPLLAVLITSPEAPPKKSVLISGGMLVVLAGIVVIWGKLMPQMDIPTLIAAKKKAFANVAEATGAGSAFYIPELKPDLFSLVAGIPAGLWNALFRPFPQHADSLMEWAAVAENFLFAGLLVFLLGKIRPGAPGKSLPLNLIVFGLMVLALGGMTVNISGALVRYKMPVIPYMALAFYLFTLNRRRANS